MTLPSAEAPAWRTPALARLDAAALRWQDGDTGIVWRSWGQGRPLVLLHGSAGSWNHWLRNIPHLAATHAVHVPDLPGCGESAPVAGPSSMGGMADALHASLRRSGRCNGPFALVGFSLGSFVAEAMALRHAASVESLVLVRGSFDGVLPPLPAGLVRWRPLMDDPVALREAHRHNLATLMFHDPSRIDDAALELHAVNQARARLDVGPLMDTREAQALERLARTPDCVCGEHDVLGACDPAAQREALHRLRPDARLHVVADAGHWAPYEQAERFNRLLDQLLQAGGGARRAAA
jgi:pimeloyl-ACP methyl ester carboxylesterase